MSLQAVARVEQTLPPALDPTEAAFRLGYAMGADAEHDEKRGRPFLTEDEAVTQWRSQP